MYVDVFPGTGSWPAALLWFAALGAFLLFVPFYRKPDRRPAGAFLLFVALSVSGVSRRVQLPGIPAAAGLCLFIFFLLSGGALVIAGWAAISRVPAEPGDEEGGLVTRGVYRYLRHPQYAGFLLLTAGMLLGRPAVWLFILWPAVLLLYCRLAGREEKSMETRFGSRWREYAASTGRFLPRRRQKRRPGGSAFPST